MKTQTIKINRKDIKTFTSFINDYVTKNPEFNKASQIAFVYSEFRKL